MTGQRRENNFPGRSETFVTQPLCSASVLRNVPEILSSRRNSRKQSGVHRSPTSIVKGEVLASHLFFSHLLQGFLTVTLPVPNRYAITAHKNLKVACHLILRPRYILQLGEIRLWVLRKGYILRGENPRLLCRRSYSSFPLEFKGAVLRNGTARPLEFGLNFQYAV